MVVKILGMGCSTCKKLYSLTEQCITELNIDCTVQKVENIKEIMAYGVMRTPALVVDNKVKCFGIIPSKEEIKKYITEEIKD